MFVVLCGGCDHHRVTEFATEAVFRQWARWGTVGLVGRSAERGCLEGALRAVERGRVAGVVEVLGEPGVGKTALRICWRGSRASIACCLDARLSSRASCRSGCSSMRRTAI